MSGCSMTFAPESTDLVLTGSKGSTEKAKVLVEYILGALEEQRQKEQEIMALSGELRSMGVGNAGFFNSGFRGTGRGRGRFGRGAGPVGRGAGAGGAGDYDGGGPHYAEQAAHPPRGAVFARGGRGGRGRGNLVGGPAPQHQLGANGPGADGQMSAPAGRGGAGSAGGAGGGRSAVPTVQRPQGFSVSLNNPPAPPPPQQSQASFPPRQVRS